MVAPESRQIAAPGPLPIVTPPPADTSGVIPGRAKALPVVDGKTGEVLYYRTDAATPRKALCCGRRTVSAKNPSCQTNWKLPLKIHRKVINYLRMAAKYNPQESQPEQVKRYLDRVEQVKKLRARRKRASEFRAALQATKPTTKYVN